MKERIIENDKLIYDKIQLPKHNYITKNLLIKRKFIKEDDIETFMYDALFEELIVQQQYDFKIVLISASYVIARKKSNKFLDQDGHPVRNRYAYFRSSIIWDLKRLTGQIRLSWEEDDDYG